MLTQTSSSAHFSALALLAACGVALLTGPAAHARAAAPFPVPPKVGDTLPSFTLKTPAGTPVALSSLLKKGPVVLVVLRGYPGYQCPFCTRQVGELNSHATDFAKHKAQILLVYPGPADNLQQRANEFVPGKNMPVGYTLVLDPSEGFLTAHGLRWNAPGETSYPSTFVVSQTGKILFAKISHEHGDRATSEEILKALP